MKNTTQKNWYDLKSASEYTSLSRKTLLGAIRDGALPARISSPNVGGKYIVSRTDIDRYMSSLAQA